MSKWQVRDYCFAWCYKLVHHYRTNWGGQIVCPLPCCSTQQCNNRWASCAWSACDWLPLQQTIVCIMSCLNDWCQVAEGVKFVAPILKRKFHSFMGVYWYFVYHTARVLFVRYISWLPQTHEIRAQFVKIVVSITNGCQVFWYKRVLHKFINH